MSRRVSVIWLVEHLAREMDVACAAVALLRARFGIDAEVHHVYGDAPALLREVLPEVVVYPFFYQTQALALEDYVARWPDATHFNMAWEQVHYPMHEQSKAPSDAFTRSQVTHNAWGPFYRDYLERHGVPADHIHVNGNPAYGLYAEPYRGYFDSKEVLAARYGLDARRRWIFVPENYRWAFLSDKRLRAFGHQGAQAEAEAFQLREFSRDSLRELLAWCVSLSRNEAIEVIFRTRPATGHDVMREFARAALPGGPERMQFIKHGTVREWVLASDVVVSSYSTTLAEAAVAGIPCVMAQPMPIPEALWCDWYGLVPTVRTADELAEPCLTGLQVADELRQWARASVIGPGDPILRVTDTVGRLWLQHRESPPEPPARRPEIAPKTYMNPLTHDQDAFTQQDVDRRVGRWRVHLGLAQ
jgi:surface carbohydrate biosynthesis protein